MKRIAVLAAGALAVVAAVIAMYAASLTPPAMPTPSAVAQSNALPANQQAWNTGTPGEVTVVWDTASGATAYRIGWLNHNDYLAAGSTWLQRFTFANVPPSVQSYQVTRLTPGEEYWFIVAGIDAGNRMHWPQRWIQKFAVTAAPTPTPTPMPMPTPAPCPTNQGPGAPDGNVCATASGDALQSLIDAGVCSAPASGIGICATVSSETLRTLIEAGICQEPASDDGVCAGASEHQLAALIQAGVCPAQ